WDEQTYLPAGGAEHRAAQLEMLAKLTHERRTDPRIGELLDTAADGEWSADPAAPEAVNVREWRRSYDRATKLPASLVAELARLESQAQHQWMEARRRSDFSIFRPFLAKMIELKRQEADAVGYKAARYDALLDQYEPGATSASLTELFAKLRADLVPLVQAIAEAPKKPDDSVLQRHYPVDRQQHFAEMAAAAVGFDFTKGRLDVAAHPFCSSVGPADCRLTTRYNPRDFIEAFFGVMHETGHGLYEQGLDRDFFGTPMGEAVSLGVHESQSRLWENTVGRSLAFWEFFLPLARGVFPQALGDVGVEEFHQAVNTVKPSLIRVEADESTYNLHVLVRFELEQALLAGDLAVDDVPTAWNQKYRDYLGLTPPDDAQGCLQDIHWSCGLVGYFPTYTIGNMLAAQFTNKADEELGGLSALVRRGDFRPLLDWLRTKIHRHGMRYYSADLVRRIDGGEPDHRPLVAELRAKYAPIYGLYYAGMDVSI
ncbi:MAG: carboxypeptidase M32, partial [Planctomycetia bacterium]